MHTYIHTCMLVYTLCVCVCVCVCVRLRVRTSPATRGNAPMTSPFACGHTSNSVSGRVDEEGGGVGCGEGAGGGGDGGGGARISVSLVRFFLFYNRPAFGAMRWAPLVPAILWSTN